MEMWSCPDCGRRFAARNQTHTCAPLGSLDDHLAGKPPEIRAIIERLIEVTERNGPFEVLPEKTRIAFAVRMSFAALQPRTGWVDGHVVLARRRETRASAGSTFSPRNHLHAFRIANAADVDDQVADWLAEAYAVGMQSHR